MLTGCTTMIPISYQEDCARKGMVLAGVNSFSGDTSTYASNGRSAISISSGETLSCVVPKDEAQACEVKKFAAVGEPKFRFNSEVKDRRLTEGVGYFFYVVPGLVLRYLHDGVKDEAIAKSDQKAEAAEKGLICQVPSQNSKPSDADLRAPSSRQRPQQ